MSIVSYTFSQMVTTGFITGLGIAVINTKLYVTNIVTYTSRISYSLGNADGILMGRHRGVQRLDLGLYRQDLLLALLCNGHGVASGTGAAHAAAFHLYARSGDPLSCGEDHSHRLLCRAAACGEPCVGEFLQRQRRCQNAACDLHRQRLGCNVLFSWLLAVVLGWGLPGIWAASILDESFKAMAYLLRWKSGKWQNARV